MTDQDQRAAELLIATTIEKAREEGRKSAIPSNVRDAWEKVRMHIIHDGAMDDHRFDLEDFFNGRTE